MLEASLAEGRSSRDRGAEGAASRQGEGCVIRVSEGTGDEEVQSKKCE
jgi:hypothetical protein